MPFPLISPGFAGLNKQEAGQTTNVGPEFALELQNAVFDSVNRVSARLGHLSLAATGLTAAQTVDVLHEFLNNAGTSTLIAVTSDLKLFSSIDSGVTWVDRTGAITLLTTDVQFVNFDGQVIGINDGVDAFQWDGVAGSFTTVVESGGTQPTGKAGLAAYGRLWRVGADNKTIQFSGLLDVDDWDSLAAGGAGSIDLSNVWTLGTDTIEGIAAFGATLVVFGKKHIIFYIDGSGSTLAVDPAQMYVVDTIEGTGLVARDSIQNIGDTGDIFYLSPAGLQSLLRVQQERTNPMVTISDNIRDFLDRAVVAETGRIDSLYNSTKGFYLLNLPVQNKLIMVDTKRRLQNGQARVAEWQGIDPNSIVSTVGEAEKQIYFGFTADVSRYDGLDDDGTAYTFRYHSAHLDLSTAQQVLATFLKIYKRLGAIILTTGNQSIVFRWGFDFKGLSESVTLVLTADPQAEYGTAEYGANGVYDSTDVTLVAGVDVSEYGADAAMLELLSVPMKGTSRYVQIGIEITINGSQISFQELDIYSKLGRMA